MTIRETKELIKQIIKLDIEEVKIKTPKFKLTIKTTS